MRASITQKGYILSTQVLDYVRTTNKSLFWASESAVESRHRYFINYYKNYKVLATQAACMAENFSIVLSIIIVFINNFGFLLKV